MAVNDMLKNKEACYTRPIKKRDSEIKQLIGCTENEKAQVFQVH